MMVQRDNVWKRLFFRTYSNESAGAFVSGKGKSNGRVLEDRSSEFKLHAKRSQTQPTALISVTTSIVRALACALQKYLGNGEPPEDIWISIIELPVQSRTHYYHAQGLAEDTSRGTPQVYANEYLFEWEIPRELIRHQVSLQTLLLRGLKRNIPEIDGGLPLSTSDLRQILCRTTSDPSQDPFETGLSIGSLARCFGARAPSFDIAFAFLADFIPVCWVNDDAQVVVRYFAGRKIRVDFDNCIEVQHGIETALNEWWLQDIDFYLDYAAHLDRAAKELAEIAELWEAYDEACIDQAVDFGCCSQELLERGRKLQELERIAIQNIEQEAVKIGL